MSDSKMICVTCKQLVAPAGQLLTGNYSLLIKNGVFIDIVEGDNDVTKSADQHYSAELVTPGFIDIHHHGMGGASDLVDFWKHPEYSQNNFPKSGVTSFLATMVYPKDADAAGTEETIQKIENIVGRTDGRGAVCEGINGEGPIVNDLGGLPSSDTAMSIPEFQALLDKMPSCKLMTISPHVDVKSGYQRIKLLLERGIVPSLGHDREATEQEILGALRLAPSTQFHITHLCNVCNFHHRTPSLVNFGLTEEFPRIPDYEGLQQTPTIEVIGDLRHVHAMTISAILKARHFSNIAFISDCTAESKPGEKVSYNNREMQVSEDGKCLYISGTNTLAGSCCSVMDAFLSLVDVFNVNIAEAVAMVSETPARIAKLDHVGKIEVGRRADLLLFDDKLKLQKTLIAGEVVYSV
ncbi:N-acetylglucosamine-6-phosphate deacetylase-like [Glandiceps talaboti]